MPTYEYNCEKCSNLFEKYLTVCERNEPVKEPCPECGEVGCVKKSVGGFPSVGVDLTLTPDKKTGGKWSALMNKMKRGLPERHQNKLGNSANMRGKRWKQ
tara:strand:+ start:253 stop:552 length:300 start_codon:yes stop_codon:yes gene_type:complete